MRCGMALALTVSLVAAPVQATAQEPVADPIARAIPHEAARLASHEPDASRAAPRQADGSAQSDWSRVRSLRRGTAVVINVKNEPGGKRRFVSADDARLIVRDSDRREESIARDDVTSVIVTTTHGSIGGAATAAAFGWLYGTALAVHLATEVPCQPSCGGVVTLMWLSAVGLPVGAGFAGYYGLGHAVTDVIYRAPQSNETM